jgi:methylmalonyl-CoA mutase N-terminal domain/subunit
MTVTKARSRNARAAPSGSPTGRIKAAQARWRHDLYEPRVRAAGSDDHRMLDNGLEVAPLYTPADLEAVGFDYLEDAGFPGAWPYARGDDPAMHRAERFVVSAYTGFGEAERCNARLKRLLEMGVEQILLAFDLPTQCGYDSDHVMATGEVGRVGVAIDTLADMEALFDGIALDRMKRVGALANSMGPVATAMFAALGRKQGVPYHRYVVNLQNDVLKEYLARGTQILPPEPAARLAVDAVAWCAEHAPGWSPMTVCYNHLNAAGAGSSRGAAMALANVAHYMDLLCERGYAADRVAPLIHMFADERHDFFASVANLRALRKQWAKMMSRRYGATTPQALALRTTVYGHGQETLQEPLNNIVRIAFGTLAYVLGGASYVYIASYDEAVGIPSDETVRVAVRTQQIIAHEHGITDTIDPLGGSYYVETLTKQIERQIEEDLAMIDASGGALALIESGLGRSLMTEGAVRRQRKVDSGERAWVTVNKWRQEPHVPNTAFRVDPDTTQRQVARTRKVKAGRDEGQVARALKRIDAASADGAGVTEACLEAVEAYATIGEICDVWRARFGEFNPSTSF